MFEVFDKPGRKVTVGVKVEGAPQFKFPKRAIRDYVKPPVCTADSLQQYYSLHIVC